MTEFTNDELLAAVLNGDLELADPRVSQRESEDAGFAEKLAELAGLNAALREMGRHEREGLRAARRGEADPLDAVIDQVVDRELASVQHGGSSRKLVWVVIGAAASLLLGFLIQQKYFSGLEVEALPQYMGEKGDLLPRGPSDSFQQFRWEVTVEPAGYFVVVVMDANGLELGRSPGLETQSWTPSAQSVESWPQRIHWTLEVHDAIGGMNSFTAEAWLSEGVEAND